MQKYLLRIVVFILIVVLVDHSVGWCLDWLQNKAFNLNPERFEMRTMYAVEKGNSDVAIIGASDASHSYISNMIADSLGMTTYNYGKDGSFFIYQNCLINLMLERYTPKLILWEIGKDCLSDSETKNVTEWQSISSLYPYYSKNEFVKNVIDHRGRFQRLYMLSGLYRHNSQLINIAEPFIIDEIVPDTKGYLPIETSGYIYPDFINQPIDHSNINNWKVELLRKTLENCQYNHVKVVFCFGPKFKNESIESTLQWNKLSDISREYNIPMVDYLNTPFFDTNAKFFKDNIHLNDDGACYYMSFFIPALLEIINS